MNNISETNINIQGMVDPQNRNPYNHFTNGVYPIVFKDAIISKMDMNPQTTTVAVTLPPTPVVPPPSIASVPQHEAISPTAINNGIPVLDLRPADPYPLYYTEPATEPNSDDNIKNNITILSTYFDISDVEDDIIKDKNSCCNTYLINALEILKVRIMNEKKVLDVFSKFTQEFNAGNDKNKRMVILDINANTDIIFEFDDAENKISYTLTVFNTEEIKYDTDENGNKYCTNSISFHTLPY